MRHFFEWLNTPNDIPSLCKWRMYALTWFILRAQVRIIRLQGQIAAHRAEWEHLDRFLKEKAKTCEKTVDKSETGANNVGITGA